MTSIVKYNHVINRAGLYIHIGRGVQPMHSLAVVPGSSTRKGGINCQELLSTMKRNFELSSVCDDRRN
jgi:hypothetical protein